MNESPEQRLFFALWPSEPVRTALAAWQERLAAVANGRRVPPDRLHMTLLFLGKVAAPQHCCLEAAADRLAYEPFTLVLDRQGHWPRPRVAWAAAAEMPVSLMGLVEALRGAARQCGLAAESRPFVPHVTLLRKVAKQPRQWPEFEPLVWHVEAFTLMRSLLHPTGARYEVLRVWPLKKAD